MRRQLCVQRPHESIPDLSAKASQNQSQSPTCRMAGSSLQNKTRLHTRRYQKGVFYWEGEERRTLPDGFLQLDFVFLAQLVVLILMG